MTNFTPTERSVALKDIRLNDPSRYTAICKTSKEEEYEYEDIPRKYEIYAEELADRSTSPEDGLIASDIETAVRNALLTLKPREERVLRKRFGIGVTDMTLEEVGRELSVTRERIRSIEAKALRKLKTLVGSKNLKNLLEAA